MSLTDRDRPAAPETPLLAPTRDDDLGGSRTPMSNKPLWIGVVVFSVLAVVLITLGVTLKTKAGPATNPAPSATQPAATLAPSSSPTIDARDQASLAARNGWKAYARASTQALNAGGGDSLPAYLAATVDGPAAKYALAELRGSKAGHFAGTGEAVAYTRIDALSELTDKVPTATLATCLDQTAVSVTKDGKPFAGKPRYIRSNVTMHRLNGVWKVYDQTDEIWTDGDCTDAIGVTS